jgi:hypothetical protein
MYAMSLQPSVFDQEYADEKIPVFGFVESDVVKNKIRQARLEYARGGWSLTDLVSEVPFVCLRFRRRSQSRAIA